MTSTTMWDVVNATHKLLVKMEVIMGTPGECVGLQGGKLEGEFIPKVILIKMFIDFFNKY